MQEFGLQSWFRRLIGSERIRPIDVNSGVVRVSVFVIIWLSRQHFSSPTLHTFHIPKKTL